MNNYWDKSIYYENIFHISSILNKNKKYLTQLKYLLLNEI